MGAFHLDCIILNPKALARAGDAQAPSGGQFLSDQG